MVVADTATLLFILQPDANAPLGDDGAPIPKCRERVELLLHNLSEAGVRVVVPTPVLAELMVSAGPGKVQLLGEISHSSAFSVVSFDQIAAVECACLTAPRMGKKLGQKGHQSEGEVRPADPRDRQGCWGAHALHRR